MRRLSILMLIPPFLAACGEGQKDAPAALETAQAAAPAVTQPAPDNLQTACRREVETLFGQTGSVVTFRPVGNDSAEVSWPAPVDGGVMTFECRTDGDRVALFRDGRNMSVDIQTAAPAAEQEAR